MSEKVYKTRSMIDAEFGPGVTVAGRIAQLGALPETHDSRRFIVVDNGESLIRVYESADLKELFSQAVVGDYCSIRFVKAVTLEGNRTMKKFDSRLWSER